MDGLTPPADVVVRRLRPDDVDTVVAIETEAFSSPWRRETFLDLVERPTLELWVLEHRTAGVVGYAVLWCVVEQGELANMAVMPEHRGRGLGSFLLASVLEAARGRGIETVFLEVRASNEAAVRLYSRFGFSEIGVRRGYYERPREDARILKTTLR